jgi:DNA polymerase
MSHSDNVAFIDFETYSESGYVWLEDAGRWGPVIPKRKGGIAITGAAAYSEHPSTEVLCLAYKLPKQDWKLWIPGAPDPVNLFKYMLNGGILEAWNSIFEYFIWSNVCHKRMGWPLLAIWQLRDSMAISKAMSMPGALDNAAQVAGAGEQKDKKGKLLINKLCVPRKPTKKYPVKRLLPRHDPQAFADLYNYCIQDIKAEKAVSDLLPPLDDYETRVFLLDQEINIRGVHIDQESLDACVDVYEQTQKYYTARLQELTSGDVNGVAEIDRLISWLRSRKCTMFNLQADTVQDMLKNKILPPDVREVLEIRSMLSSNSIKKLYAIKHRLSSDGRLRDLFRYQGADRTGRWSGTGPQPQNLPSSGPDSARCRDCGRTYSIQKQCPFCRGINLDKIDWTIDVVNDALEDINTRELTRINTVWNNPVKTLSGCLRGLFSAAPGHDLICSDYSAIEAVVLAFMANEQWRMDVFNSHGKIYEMTASKITGVPFQEILDYRKQHGQHHPHRKPFGKIPELASGYGGAIGAWKAFGADKFMDDSTIDHNVKMWRQDSPNIVQFWWDIERAAENAIKHPGQRYAVRDVKYIQDNGILYCQLPSGRFLVYHNAQMKQKLMPWGDYKKTIHYMGWNTDTSKGIPYGWTELDNYGPKLVENIVQAISRDILAYAMLNLNAAGYPIVLHVHDEIVAEVSKEFGSIEEFEQIMSTLPKWCENWPVKATGGWRGKRYRKD